MAERYNFKYLPLVGKLPGKSMVEQTETAINELASVVYDNVGYVGNLAEEVQTANTNASNALDKATEALETSGRVYIKLIAAVDVNDYYDSELYYINNDGSTNIPVRDRGFLEVKTNDDKTACEQVFIADSTGTPYYRHGVITEQTLGEETTYVVTWGSWYQGATAEYVTEYVQEEIRQHGNVPVGFEYFSMNPNVPQGSLPLLGGEYNRSTYSDLWEWVQQQTGYLKTEAEWQALSTANNGNVPYYSDGDGSTTFRVPSLQCWVRGANGSVSTVGSYLAAGLPNITGQFTSRATNYLEGQLFWAASSGALYYSGRGAGSSDTVSQINGAKNEHVYKLDASRSSSIYGNSSTVQPESIVGMWLVKAYGTIVDTGTIDEQQYIDDRIAALPNTFLPLAGGTMSGAIHFNGANNRSFGFDLTNNNNNMDIGWNWDNRDGAGFGLRSTDDTGSTPGSFSIYARDRSNSTTLNGSPDGRLTWGDDKVCTLKRETIAITATSNNGTITSKSAIRVGNVVQVNIAIKTSSAANIGATINVTLGGLPQSLAYVGTASFYGNSCLIGSFNSSSGTIRVLSTNLAAGSEFGVNYIYVTTS